MLRRVTVLLVVLGAIAGEARASGGPGSGCADPIVGLWSARYHTSGMEDWHDFMLSIERVKGSPNEVEGLIRVEVWNGGKDLDEPPKCVGGASGPNHYVVEMRARGSFNGSELTFDGQDLVVRERKCGGAPAYAIDHLFGELVAGAGGRVLELGNNDGTRRLTRRIAFKRVRCAVLRVMDPVER